MKRLKTAELKNIIRQEKKRRQMACKKCSSKLRKIKSLKSMVRFALRQGSGIRYNILEGSIFYKAKVRKLVLLKMIELWLQKHNNKALAFIYDLNRKTASKIFKNLSK